MEIYGGQYEDFAYYYDALMNDIDYNMWSDYIGEIIKKYSVQYKDVLEIACGTGNMAINMTKRGYKVTALDISEDMLSIAYDKAVKEGVHVSFIAQDMRSININNKFGIVLCLCDSINYVTDENDLLKLFTYVYNHLKDGGIFIFDINSSYKLKSIIGNNTFTYNEDDLAYIWDNVVTEEDTVEFYLTFFVRCGNMYRRFDELHIERIYDTEDIINMLRNSGFTQIHAKDAFTFNDISATSERINFIVRK